MLIVNKSTGAESVTYIDNVECNKYAKAPEFKSVGYSEGKIIVETTEKLDGGTVKTENLKLCLDDEEIAITKIETSDTGLVYTLTPEVELHSAIEYTLKVSSDVRDINGLSFIKEGYVEYKFVTPAALYDITSLNIENGAINASIINDTQDVKSAIMVTLFREWCCCGLRLQFNTQHSSCRTCNNFIQSSRER